MSVEQFRQRARAWLEANAQRVTGDEMTTNAGEYGTDLGTCKRFQKALYEAGFVGITWPSEYGGQGLGSEELVAWSEVSADYRLPIDPFVVGLGMPAPTIVELGTEEQKERYLAKLLSGEEVWCQLFSEPSGGSDVAALRTSATRTDTGWVINGQKVWTSDAQFSDFGTIIARTDPTVPKHSGITMFIVDMHHPGVTVRPLRVATGESPFNEVYFDNVEVPADAVIGEVNGGWQAALVMLRNERIMIGASGRSRANPLAFDSMVAAARRHGSASTQRARHGLAEVYARELALAEFGRVLHEEALAGTQIGARGSVGKSASSQQALWAADLAGEILGEELAIDNDDLFGIRRSIIAGPGNAVAGGSIEIQRNIIGERILGLPKDGGVDKNVPFNQLRLGR